MQIGLILPHFGRHASTSRLVDGIAELERLGFDSVWARDHVVYTPHSFEDPDITFLDPFLVLAVAASHSTRLRLGTATLIPHRHPVHTALLLSNLARLASPERLLIGWGTGAYPHEFRAVAAPGPHRGRRLDEHVEAVRAILSGQTVSHHGEHYAFDEVRIKPPGGPIEFWYGGATPAGIARAARAHDGLLASRIPRSKLAEGIAELRRLAAEAGRPEPRIGLVTMVSPAPTVEAGLAAFDAERVAAEVARRFPDRAWDPATGLEGVMLAGPGDRIAAEIRAFEAIGVGHLVLDLRARFSDWEDATARLASDVLPLIRRAAHDPIP